MFFKRYSKTPLIFGLLGLAAATAAQAATLELANGDRIEVEIIAQDGKTLRFRHPVLGEMSLDRQQVRAVLADAAPTAAAEAGSGTAATPADAGLLGTGYLAGWKRNLELGLNGATGNSRSSNLHLGLDLGIEQADERDEFRAAWNRKSENGKLGTNNFFANYVHDWLQSHSRWFWFAQVRYDWDEFKDWDHRLALSAGPGYRILVGKPLQLRLRFGPGGYRNWGGMDPGFTPELPVTLAGDWQIGERHTLGFSNTFAPDLRDTGEFRNLSALDWRFKLTDELAFQIGLSNEYDSTPVGGDLKNDFKYNASVVWGL